MSKNLILHIPHSSNIIPDKTGYVVSDEVLEAEKLLLTDWHTEDLFSFPTAISVIAEFNRVFCDVERFADDAKEIMSRVGMGFIYQNCDDGSKLRNLSDELKTDILNKYYSPHHQRLNAVVNEQLSSTGQALIIDCHSFSNKPFRRDLNQFIPRPDFCVGIDDYHTPQGLYELIQAFIKSLGYKVQINTPYSGSIVPMEYYQKSEQVHSVMIEVNRDLYMIPGTNQKNEHYVKVKSDIQKLLTAISNNWVNINLETIA